MKKNVKKKRVNSSSKKSTYTTKYKTKNNTYGRVNTTKNKTHTKTKIKTKNIIKLGFLIMLIIFLIMAYSKLGMIGVIGGIIALAFIIGMIFLIIKSKGKGKKKLFTILAIFILLGFIAGMGIVAGFLFYVKSLADPLYKEENLITKETTEIYDKDGNEYARLGSEMREKVTYEQLPEVLIDAIIATEDSRYFQHNGFDAPRFIKASFGQVVGKSGAGGASTLSMQVVKNVFTDAKADAGTAGIIRKFEDIYLAVFKLEKNYTKEEIIEFYVNNHFLGGNVYGVEEASQFYFGKSVSELNLSEAAVIAGMFKSPNYYRPDTHPENAEARRKTVLYLMNKHGYISDEEEKIANSVPVSSLTVETVVEAQQYQDFIDTVVSEVKEKYGVNPYTTSLKLYTTLDRSRQDAVDRVQSGEAYSWIDDRVQTGISVLDSETGAILAVGAGRNRTGIGSYNRAIQIKRQPGSTAKPLFDYGPGMEYNDWSTYTLFDDSKYSYSNGRSIKNWDGGYYGTITLRRALSTSRNIPALKAFQQVDNNKIKEFVTNLGLTPEICETGYTYDRENNICVNPDNKNDKRETINLHEAHSIGAFTGVSPLEMSAAYAAFSNGGYYNEPYTVSKIEFRTTGEVIEHQSDRKQVMSDSTAFMISSVLKDVALTGGTPYNVACKTGTTNFDENTMNKYGMPGDAIRDSWVVGYSTKTTIAMWYGYDSFNQESINEGYVLHNIPATIQKDNLFKALVNQGAMESGRSDFNVPSSVVKVAVAQGSNPAKLAGPGTSPVYEYFKKGTEPTETAIGEATLSGPSNLRAELNENTKTVKLSWSAVSPGEFSNNSYGAFGYNVYKDGNLITWTESTNYTYSNSNPYGTYKIVATYKGYSGIKSEGAEVRVTEPKKEEPKKEEPKKEDTPTDETEKEEQTTPTTDPQNP